MEPPDSGGGWSDDGAPKEPGREGAIDASHAFRIEAGERYLPLDLAGRGGMGEVVVARDRRLNRDVALKRIVAHRGDETLSRRLAREAWITARLEHPSIVPIYDAGVGEDGRLFYTMRLIHGRSLGDALAKGRDPARRLALLRHFLAACEAVAYAHSHGIVHRDLKPANVMVGGFGETQIVDWGLAGFASEATARVFASELPGSADLSVAAAKGTPHYMSPEQARGAATDTRADVWALGAILHEIAVGEKLVSAREADQALALLRSGDVDRARLHASDAPAPLQAIIDKATAAAPSARYRDAGDLAADLARHLDGRRVEAHEYTAIELLRRLARQLRVPLIAGLSALLAGSLAIVVSFHRIREQRTRALSAESEARAALADNRETAAWALARQAVAELAEGAIAEAELLAAHALSQGESADARGVAAAAHANPHPTRAETIVLPGCTRVVPGTWSEAVCLDDSAVSLWSLSPPRRRWSRPIAARSALLVSSGATGPRVVITSGSSELVVLEPENGAIEQRHTAEITTGFVDRVVDVGDGDHIAATEGRVVTVISLKDKRTASFERPCDPIPVAAIAARDGRLAIVCANGRVTTMEKGHARATKAPSGLGGLQPISAGLSEDGRRIAIGGVNGDLVEVDLETGHVDGPRRILDGPINHIGVLDAARRIVVVSGEHGGARVFNLEAGAELMRLPIAGSAAFRVDARGVLTGGSSAGRWELNAGTPPRATSLPAGLSEIAISPDGRLLAAARGDGRVSIAERTSGRWLAELSLGAGVVKTLDFAPDGRRLAVSISRAEASPRLYAVDRWTPLPLEPVFGAARRLLHDARGELIALRYAPPIIVWSANGRRGEIESPEMYDISCTPDRGATYLLAVDGGIFTLKDRVLQAVDRDPGAKMIAVSSRGAWIATGHDNGISVRREAGGAPAWIPSPDARLSDLAVSPDDRYLVGARTDGTIMVWGSSDLGLVATLRGHRQRVSNLVFAPDGLLVSAGWDGQILTWDLSVLKTDPANLVKSAEAGWGAQLPLVLKSYKRS